MPQFVNVGGSLINLSNKARFSQMVDFLRSLLTLEEANEVEEIDPSKPLLELTEFYGYWLEFGGKE